MPPSPSVPLRQQDCGKRQVATCRRAGAGEEHATKAGAKEERQGGRGERGAEAVEIAMEDDDPAAAAPRPGDTPNKSGQSDSEDSAASEDDGEDAYVVWPRHVPAGAMNPLLAYPHHLMDTLNDGRDEPERMKPVRAVLHLLKANGSPNLLELSGEGSLASVLGATDDAKVTAAINSLMKGAMTDAATVLIRVRLVAPSTEVLTATEADMLDETQRRTCCVAVRDEDSTALLDMPLEVREPPRVVVEFDKSFFAHARHATVTLKRVGVCGVDLSCVGATGRRLACRARDLDERLLDRLYAVYPADPTPYLMLPKIVGDLPASLAGQVARFWQDQMRCHVVTAVLAPKGASRPLAIQAVTARKEGQRQVATVRALIHATSTACMCALHKLVPVEKRPQHIGERFVSSKAEMVLSMCGHKLEFRDKNKPGWCPHHRENTPHVPQLAHICCGSTSASLSCTHRTAAPSSARKSGLWHRNMHMNKATLLHARILIAACMRCNSKAATLVGPGNEQKMKEMCEELHEQVEKKLNECDELRAREEEYEDTYSRVELLKNDGAAVDLLQTGGVYSCHADDGSFILARQREGRHTPLKGPLVGLAATHGHLFPYRSNKRKR